jgi:hypothetical protein
MRIEITVLKNKHYFEVSSVFMLDICLLNRDIKIANISFENVSQFKYLGMTVTNQNLIQEEIKRRLNSANTCYHSVQSLPSSRLMAKNLKKLEYTRR